MKTAKKENLFISCPYYHKENFLSEIEQREIFEYTLNNSLLFKDTQKYGSMVKGIMLRGKEFRHQKFFYPDQFFQEKFGSKVLALLPQVANKLQIKFSNISRTSCQIAATNNGQFGKPHIDSTQLNKIAFVYYFFKLPKAFRGGDLILYDTSIGQGDFNLQRFTKIENKNNLLVAFPACFFHEITKVTCDSGFFEDSRFAVSFWVTLA